MKKIMLIGAVMASLLLVTTGCSTGSIGKKTVDEECVYCGNSPSVVYETENGSECYVCDECSSTCMLCGDKPATKHYTNMFDTVMFVCDDCYQSVLENQ